jgi:hypothetical protein
MLNVCFGLVINSEPNKWRPVTCHSFTEGDPCFDRSFMSSPYGYPADIDRTHAVKVKNFLFSYRQYVSSLRYKYVITLLLRLCEDIKSWNCGPHGPLNLAHD